MLLATVLLPSTAVVFGIVLALWHLRPVETRRNPPWQIGILHGALGIGGLAALIVLLQGPRRGDAMGVGSFGTAAAWLFAAAIAAGLTIPELQKAIETKLADGYLKEPKVSAEVLNYRPFYILGEVMKPGEYPYTSGLTVLNAVATAEGFTYRADTHKVYIKRATSLGEHEVPLTTATPVEPGDTIRIGERFF